MPKTFNSCNYCRVHTKPGNRTGKKLKKSTLKIPGKKNAILEKLKFYKKISKSAQNLHEKAIFLKGMLM